MIIFKKEQDLRQYLSEQTANGRVVGFVPTMGALHDGHKSLISTARASGALVVCSVFVNPTQFNDKSDFEKYPVSVEADIELMINAGCDVAFMPAVQEMYPKGLENGDIYDFGYLDTILEGAQRPGHFKGVGQIVARLVDIVQPSYLYLGQKDYQQIMVIKKMLEITAQNDKVQVVVCPTLREPDGLAMSSRNVRLTDPQRILAVTLYQCLVSIQSKQQTTSFNIIQKECKDILTEKGFTPEYVALADANDLTLLEDFDQNKKMIALIAAKISDVRLIDNLIINPSPENQS
jgi:pantoate--beta-alanine ligase